MTKVKFQIITVNWSAHQHSLGECGRKLLAFMLKLKAHNPVLFGNWYETAYSKKAALNQHIELDLESIKYELSGKHLADSAISKYPFVCSFWNGNENDGETAGLRVSLKSSESKFLVNTVTVSLPVEGDGYEFYRNKENQDTLVKLMTDYWKAERLLIDHEVVWNNHEPQSL